MAASTSKHARLLKNVDQAAPQPRAPKKSAATKSAAAKAPSSAKANVPKHAKANLAGAVITRQTSLTKPARLEMRTSAEMRVLLGRAAAYSGRTVTDFVLASAQEAAMRTIQDHEIIRLSSEDSLKFANALTSTNRKPNANLVKAAKAYKKTVGA